MQTDLLLNRREALTRLGAVTLLGLGVWPGQLRADNKTGTGTFRFLAVNDLHHDSTKCDPWFAALVKQMKTHENIEFCLGLGDLTDKGKRENLGAIRDHFAGLGVPFYAQLGNHDYLTPTDRRAYEELFPDRINYGFGHRGWQFLGLDSTDGQRFTGTYVQDATLRWLDERLPKLDRRLPTVVYTHFPLGMSVNYHPLNSDQVLERFRDFNLQGVYGGHYHAYTERQHWNVPVLTNRCCAFIRNNHDGSKQKGYFLVTAADGRLATQFIEFQGPGTKAA